MKLSVEIMHGTPVVRVSGDVDMSNVAMIERTVGAEITNQPLAMVLDLSEVTYLDSAGIRLLYQLDSRLDTHQQRLVIVVAPGARIRRSLEAAGVIGSLVLASSLDAALQRVEPQSTKDEGKGDAAG